MHSACNLKLTVATRNTDTTFHSLAAAEVSANRRPHQRTSARIKSAGRGAHCSLRR